MITKEQIELLQQRLAWALNQADKAKAAAIAAEKAYDDKFVEVVATFDADNPDLVQAKNEAEKALDEATEKATTIRQEAQRVLGDYFLRPDAEAKPADGFSMRMEKEPSFDPEYFLREVVDKKVTFLLKLDEKAIQRFVTANAEKDGDLYKMPDYLRGWLPGLDVQTIQKPLISDKTLIGLAPENEPEVVKPIESVSDIPF